MKNLLCFLVFVLMALGGFTQTESIKLSIFFGGGSYYIDEEQVQLIHQTVDSIADINKYQITIYSHTDNRGGREFNEWLSKMRSFSVLQQLVYKDIQEELVIVKDFGQEDPLYTNRDYAGRLSNRRVDLIFWPVLL